MPAIAKRETDQGHRSKREPWDDLRATTAPVAFRQKEGTPRRRGNGL